MRRAIWSDAARADLRGIQHYLSETFGQDVSREITERIVLAGRFLLDHPRAGAGLENSVARKWKPRGTRYLLIYFLTDDGIDIVRVRHASEDWRPLE